MGRQGRITPAPWEGGRGVLLVRGMEVTLRTGSIPNKAAQQREGGWKGIKSVQWEGAQSE